MPKKIRELKQMLKKSGFTLIPKRGKGSHTVWKHPFYDGKIVLSGKDGKDANKYQEQEIIKAIKEVKRNES